MARGIFVEQPFYANPKCIVFGVLLIAGYWLLPGKNLLIALMIFITGYMLLAWYDFLYNCDAQLFSGTAPIGMTVFDAWGKPMWRKGKPRPGYTLVSDQEATYRLTINKFHIFAVMTFFLAMAYFGLKATKAHLKDPRIQLGSGLRAALVLAALWVLLYHGTRLFIFPRMVSECPSVQAEETSNLRTINIIHIAGVVPVLLYCAWYGARAKESAWYVLGVLGIMAGVYHGFRMLFPRQVRECSPEEEIKKYPVV